MIVKYQIFVSSTYEDLKDERDQVIKAILEMGHIPVGMEMFSAADEEQWKIIARQIEEVDYYIVIIAHRYGSVTNEGISYTEKEYDYAVKQGIPVLGFLLADKASWPGDRFDEESGRKKSLQKFKSKVKTKTVSFWRNGDELNAKCAIALGKIIRTTPRIGWVKANEITGPEVVKELTRLSSENAELRRNIEALKKEANNKQLLKIKQLVMTLNGNKKEVSIWKKNASGWSNPIEINLFTIFNLIAPALIAEAAVSDLALRIAVSSVKPADLRPLWPIPQNQMGDILADLASLDLVQPSTKKHPIKDENEYWVLTGLGKQLLKTFRLHGLKAGEAEASPSPKVEPAPL